MRSAWSLPWSLIRCDLFFSKGCACPIQRPWKLNLRQRSPSGLIPSRQELSQECLKTVSNLSHACSDRLSLRLTAGGRAAVETYDKLTDMLGSKTERPDPEELTPQTTATLRLLYSKELGVVVRSPLALPVGETVIGRTVQSPGIALPDDGQTSRKHALVRRPAVGECEIEDLESSNGTLVNGHKIKSAVLRDGDVIRVGNTLFLFRMEQPGCPFVSIDSLRGQSQVMARLRYELSQVAATETTVLLLGESGSGKEVAARALHQLSGVSGAFVPVNCGAIPDTLAESLLFGQVGGAFTGAQAAPGFFRAAHGGTLFLDEIGELPLHLQTKLLRVVEDRSVTPVGSVSPVPCRVRLIAATNRDLKAGVSKGTIRGDLYARLAEIVIQLPPLRQRREDILLLLKSSLGEGAPPVGPKLAEALVVYHWPFNVRELLKVATELRVKGADQQVLGYDLVAARLAPASEVPPPESVPSPPVLSDAEVALLPPTREQLVKLLASHQGRVAAAARTLGRSRAQLYRWLCQYGIDPEQFRP